jgi:dienelactone hydrolase/guanyl-specific ribonuclease Sa
MQWFRFLSLGSLLAFALAIPASAQITARSVEYTHDGVALEGAVVFDKEWTGKKPGVLIVHEQGALSLNSRTRAGQIARLGYITFCVDLFGKKVEPKSGPDASGMLGLAKDRKLVQGRLAAAIDAFSKQQNVDAKRLSAVGYGVGGTAVLELARSGYELEGVVGLHCDLSNLGNDPKKISASVLVIVGGDDPQIPTSQITGFEEEMRRGGVDWQTIKMGGVAHDFTFPQAGRNVKGGTAYDVDADKRSFDQIRLFLAEMFAPPVSPAKAVAGSPPAKSTPAAAPKGIPDKVLKVLKHVDDQGEALDGYEGGRNFGNFERRLPITDSQGKRIKYREWDVNPLRPGVNRGAERLVTGSDGSAHFTDDHYATFKKIR